MAGVKTTFLRCSTTITRIPDTSVGLSESALAHRSTSSMTTHASKSRRTWHPEELPGLFQEPLRIALKARTFVWEKTDLEYVRFSGPMRNEGVHQRAEMTRAWSRRPPDAEGKPRSFLQGELVDQPCAVHYKHGVLRAARSNTHRSKFYANMDSVTLS